MKNPMELILIACCKEKRSGGTPKYSGSTISEELSETAYNRLLSARSSLARIKGLAPGPDLGGPDYQEQILYQPAYQRYAGRMYQRSRFEFSYPMVKDKKVIIISALYGLIDAGDSIRFYDAVMDETLPSGTRLSTWWRQHQLGGIVEEYVLTIKPTRVHDLLSGAYRSALAPWPPIRFQRAGIQYIPYDYPGEGTGSLWHRGDDLFRLLATG